MGWEQDIHMGNFSEIGESLRGMQDSHLGGDDDVGAAQRALGQLRGALGQLAQRRFGAHAPVSKTMRSPYKDSTQIGISMTGTFTANPNGGSWAGSVLPQISGLTRVYKSFKPTKAIVTELVTVDFFTQSLGTATRVASVTDAADIVLVQAFSGADNCFPNAPTEANGISGPTFANNSLGNGISWPTINGGIDMTVAFAVEQSVVYQVTPPPGFTSDDISQIRVKIRSTDSESLPN